MADNIYLDLNNRRKIYNTYIKHNENVYAERSPYNPFNKNDMNPTIIKIQKRYDFLNQDIPHDDKLRNPYSKTKIPAYFQPIIPAFQAYKEQKGSIVNYNTMINKLGWN